MTRWLPISIALLALAGCDPEPECTGAESRMCTGPGGCAGSQMCLAGQWIACGCFRDDDAGAPPDAGGNDGGTDGGADDAGPVSTDGGTDAGVPADAGPCTATVPMSGFGTSRGRNVLPFTLTDCSGAAYDIYGPEYCGARFTVLVIGAGWCGPCRTMAMAQEAEINAVYGPRGVRVLSVLIQDESYMAPDTADCTTWTSDNGLSNRVLIDPTQETQLYFPMGALPALLVFDDMGTIRFREYGFAGGFGTLRAELDALLAP